TRDVCLARRDRRGRTRPQARGGAGMSITAPPAPASVAGTPLADAPDGRSTATRTPGRGRRWLGWLLVVALVALVSAAGLLLSGEAPGRKPGLDPDSAGPSGALALTELLRDQGIEVTVFRDRAAAARAAAEGDTTLVMTDPVSLSDDAVQALVDSADAVVVLSGS